MADRREGPGIAATNDPAAALLATLDDWPAERVLLCGMAGSRGGLREAPYVPCPAGRDAWKRQTVQGELGSHRFSIAPGVSNRDGKGRPDVMRGEETQIFGAMALDPALANGRHCVVLPGTHSKWAAVDVGRIAGFRTFISGELFAMLKRSSLFVEQDGGDAADRETGFEHGLARCAEGAELTSLLFEARSSQLEDGRSAAWARGFVSGLLIGAELREMEPADEVAIVGEPELAQLYGTALARSGISARRLDGEACAIAGLGLLDDD